MMAWIASAVRRLNLPVDGLRSLRDRALHTFRRHRATSRLLSMGVPDTVLFVCHGNICRSPYAAAAFERRLDSPLRSHIRVVSAGFLEPDRAPPEEALRVACERGLDLSTHRSRRVEKTLVEGSDLVIVMDTSQRRALLSRWKIPGICLVFGDLDPCSIQRRRIRDPITQPEGVFRETFDRIDRCVEMLVDAIRRSRPV